MKNAIRGIGLGLFLMAACAMILLVSDLSRRNPPAWTQGPEITASAAQASGAKSGKPADVALQHKPADIKKVALFYYGPDPMIERGIQGFTNGLNKLCMEHNVHVKYTLRHAQGDFSQIPQLAQQMDDGGFDLLAPMTTPCLSAALAMVHKTPIVFSMVYDPIAAGIREDFTNHQSNVTGIGSFPPLEETMDYIQRLLPKLRRLGTIYNPSEANSSKAVKIGTAILKSRGIALETTSATSASEISAAALALAQRGVEAVWLTGDNTVLLGIAAVAGVAKDAALPLICNDIEMLEHGALAAVGFDSYATGWAAAEPAFKVLNKEPPGNIPIRNVSLRRMALNTALACELGLRLPPEVIASADILTGHLPKKMRLALIELLDAPAIEATRKGMLDGLDEAGLHEGRDFTLRRLNAQGEISMLDSMVDAALADQSDIIATITTPALQTAMRKVKDRPVVFALALDPLLIGDAGSHAQHQSNVAGIFDFSPFEAMLDLIRKCLPQARRVGTLFSPSEYNSVVFKDCFAKAASAKGMELVALPASSSMEVGQAARALAQKNVDLICQIHDNQNDAAFPVIADAARDAKLPLFSFTSEQAEQGAILALANDHYQGGKEAGAVMARVMRGQAPASLPYRPMQQTRLSINLEAARSTGVNLPPDVIAAADLVIGDALPHAAAAKEPTQRASHAQKRIIRMINYSDATHVDSIMAGVRAGVKEQGWQPENYVLRVSNAQGDMAALVGIIEAAIDEKPDVLLVTSTPALQAVMQRVPPNQPVIFGAVGAPVAAGAGKSYTEHLTNVTGISSESDFAGMAKVVKQCFPNARAVGTLFTPTEINSIFYKESFEKELNKLGISLVARAVYMPGEVPAAADALAQTDISAICQIMDNLTAAAFPAIAGAARRQRMPLFSFMSDQVATGGAILAVARDYEQAGRDMVELAALLFQEHSLGTIPFRLISKTILCLNPKNLEYCSLQMPAEIMQSAIIVKDTK